VFAGKNPDKSLEKLARAYQNVQIIANPSAEKMQQLICEAAVCMLYTGQISGVKLKLINALYSGNYCLANEKMVAGSGLEALCLMMPENPADTIALIKNCFNLPFSEAERIKRLQALTKLFNESAICLLQLRESITQPDPH
jgi:hypothetical protein